MHFGKAVCRQQFEKCQLEGQLMCRPIAKLLKKCRNVNALLVGTVKNLYKPLTFEQTADTESEYTLLP